MDIRESSSSAKLPRVAITFCTQCKWMLRATYYGQELLSTFGTAIGEIALLPSTGGVFRIDLVHGSQSQTASISTIWDRKIDGGFPETKILKQRVRDLIEPEKNLGHSDTPSRKVVNTTPTKEDISTVDASTTEDPCEDCQTK